MNSPEDSDLITRFRSGDRSAFDHLVLKYQHRIYNLCRHLIQDSDDARDAAQDAFIKAYRGLTNYRPDASLYTWLYRIAVNTCLDYNKKTRPSPLDDESSIDNLPSAQPSPERLYESKETVGIINAALRRLPKKLRAAIVLKEIEDLSYEEIAHTLSISAGTVKSRISRGREELRKLLQRKV